MTAPIIPPNGGAGDSGKLMDMEDADFAKSLGLEKTHPTAPEPTTRDTDGKFLAKDKVLDGTTLDKDTQTEPEKGTEATKEAEPAEGAEAAKPVEGEASTPEPVKPPLTKFQVFDKEGELEVPADLVFNYKVDGKMVEKVPLEKVVHLAQQATYNARQVQDLSDRNTAGDQQLQQVQKQLQEYEQSISQMFQDENLYVRARELHQQSNSPERVAAAARAETEQIRQQYQQHQEQAQVAQFIQGTIEPAMQELVRDNPSVTLDDIAGRMALGLKAFEVNGRVPVTNLPKVAHFLNTEVSEWTTSVHAKRSEATVAASKTLDKDRATVQSKQRQIGKALAPVGAVATAVPQPAPIKRAADVLNDPMFGGPQ